MNELGENAVAAIVGITLLVALALINGIDGAILFAGLAVISGLGGYPVLDYFYKYYGKGILAGIEEAEKRRRG